ncbi:MAG: DUF4168 domain-containing protein [Kastovskya adunca ATA6-11-RM4]|jgi:hypothetical protein|nr:DUF4168 domain-containing protein [Kastovskya adunca ATA6-11-RM4]
MMTLNCSHPQLNKIFSRSLIIGALTAMGLLSGLTPGISKDSASFVTGVSAYAQDISNEEATNYARAVLLMEPLRQAAYNEIKKIQGSRPVPNIICSQEDSLRALPRDAQGIATNYCNQSKRIVESNGFTIARFNAMTQTIQSNPTLERRIQNELIRLQR